MYSLDSCWFYVLKNTTTDLIDTRRSRSVVSDDWLDQTKKTSPQGGEGKRDCGHRFFWNVDFFGNPSFRSQIHQKTFDWIGRTTREWAKDHKERNKLQINVLHYLLLDYSTLYLASISGSQEVKESKKLLFIWISFFFINFV